MFVIVTYYVKVWTDRNGKKHTNRPIMHGYGPFLDKKMANRFKRDMMKQAEEIKLQFPESTLVARVRPLLSPNDTDIKD